MSFVQSPKAVFQEFFKGQANFMTPEPVRYGQFGSGRFVYEISMGKGFDDKPIFGVTVLVKQGKEWTTTAGAHGYQHMNKMVRTMGEAVTHVEHLKMEAANDG